MQLTFPRIENLIIKIKGGHEYDWLKSISNNGKRMKLIKLDMLSQSISNYLNLIEFYCPIHSVDKVEISVATIIIPNGSTYSFPHIVKKQDQLNPFQ